MEANKFIFIILLSLVLFLSLGFSNGYEDGAASNTPVVFGNITQTRRFMERRFRNYPNPGSSATGVGALSSSTMIQGMRLTRMNNTDGLWTLTSGGVNHTFVNFDFRGSGIGRAYDFNIELFGTGATKSASVVLISLSSLLFCILYF